MAKYSKGAQKKVESAMKRMEKGKLRSGKSGKKVTNPKQAIAIGLSEARKKGAKVPKKKTATKKSAVKKKASPKKTARKAAPRKATTTRNSTVKKKSAPKKKTATKSAATKKAGPKKKATAKKEAPIKTKMRSAVAENETPAAPNEVQTGMLMGEDPIRAVDQKAFDKFTAKGDPRQRFRLSSKPRSAIRPSGKKPLYN